MKIKGLIEQDFLQYKNPSMFIIMPYCSFKCQKECGIKCCQNSYVANLPIIQIDEKSLIKRYLQNSITKSIVFGGLQPFDSWEQLYKCISIFRRFTTDDIVVYTGYYKEQISDKINYLSESFKNIIIKFGRFIPNKDSHYDQALGINLANQQQYAEKIS